MKLINANVLLEKIEKRKKEVYDQSFAPDPYKDAYDCCRFDELNIIRGMIKNASTIDPVKHGTWIETPPRCRFATMRYECSVCGKAVWEKYNFCPNCGAKMKE